MADERKMVNIRLDAGLWQRVKVRAAMRKQTLQEYVEQVLAESINKKGGS